MNQRKRMALIMIACLLITVTLVPAIAQAASANVYIYVSDMTGKYTSSVGLYKNVKGEGTNYSDSTNRLYVILYSADPGKGWGKRDQRLLNPGSSSGQFSASNSVAASWRVELNPYGVGTSGCRGFGKVTAN